MEMTLNLNRISMFCLILIVLIRVCGAAAAGECSINCVQPADGLACDLVTNKCLHGCKEGFGGLDCWRECCANCKMCTEVENSTSMLCTECADGFYVDDSDCVPCSRGCVGKTCRAGNGYCEFGCQAGYYGNTCTDKCSESCKDRRCKADDGACENGCSLSVLHGSHCSKSCSEGCVKRECDQSGRCLHGCNNFVWDPDCSSRCSDSCREPKYHSLRVCNKATGECLYGCLNGSYWGPNCTSNCSANCIDQECDSQTGTCIHGCIKGYKGDHCTEKDDGINVWIYVGIVISVVVVIAIVIICCCVYHRKKRS